MAAEQRRRLEQRGPQTPQQPPGLHHHHSMHAAVGGSPLPGPQASSAAGPGTVAVAPHGGVGRPSLERAHTFPTPPTSAHSVLGMSGSDGGYSWNGSNLAGHSNQPLSVDVGLSNARSMPSTPATTPPGHGLQTTQGYANGAAAYDGTTRPTYSAPPPSSQAQYGAPPVARYGQPLQPGPYIKHEMRPPAARAPGSSQEGDRADGKPVDGMLGHGASTGAEGMHHAPGGDEEAEHEHEAQYNQENQAAAAAYDANRASYSYSTGGAVGSMPSEHAHLSPEINGSPNAHPASGRATPRTAPAQQPQWNTGYHTPPRAPTASSNLYNVMSHDPMGKPTNGAPAVGEGYPSQLAMPNAMSAGYPSQQTHPIMNGSTSSTSSNKRMREMEDDGGRNSRPSSRGTAADGEVDGLKRRKTIREDGLPMVANGLDLGPNQGLNRARSTIVQRRR